MPFAAAVVLLVDPVSFRKLAYDARAFATPVRFVIASHSFARSFNVSWTSLPEYIAVIALSSAVE